MKPVFTTLKIALIGGLILSISILLFAAWVIAQFPSDKEIRGCFETKMYHLHLCPRSDQYVALKDISPYLVKAVVLTEDSLFWSHQGFDFDEMERSLKKNLEKGKYARGGSTITQQLAKNLFLTEEKTLSRKLREAIITMRLEKTLSKKEILERYLNVAHLGKGIFGVKAAAMAYFQKSPAELTVLESAYLTFLLPSPEKYSRSFLKGNVTPFAQKRLGEIIDHLYKYDRISETEYTNAHADLSRFMSAAAPPNAVEILGRISPEDSEPVTDESLENTEPEDD